MGNGRLVLRLVGGEKVGLNNIVLRGFCPMGDIVRRNVVRGMLAWDIGEGILS